MPIYTRYVALREELCRKPTAAASTSASVPVPFWTFPRAVPKLIKSFVSKMGLNYEIGKIDHDTVDKFNKLAQVNYIPQSYLIDRQGRLRGVFTTGGPTVIEKMKSEVAKVMGEAK